MKLTIKELLKRSAEDAASFGEAMADKEKLIEGLRANLEASQRTQKSIEKEYNDFVVRLAEYLGIVTKDSWGERKQVTADEIVFAIMKLKGFIERFEGAKVDVNVENSRLWYMMRVAMHDPSLTPDSVRNGYLENSDVGPGHYTRPSQDTCEERPRDKFPY